MRFTRVPIIFFLHSGLPTILRGTPKMQAAIAGKLPGNPYLITGISHVSSSEMQTHPSYCLYQSTECIRPHNLSSSYSAVSGSKIRHWQTHTCDRFRRPGTYFDSPDETLRLGRTTWNSNG